MLTEILSLVSVEFLALQGCLELVVRVFCVDLSPAPTIDPYIPRAKRPPLYLESFLRWVNKRIDRTMDKLAPCITVRRRHDSSGQRTKQSPRSPRPPYVDRRSGSPSPHYWAHDYFLFKWRHFWWRDRHRKRRPTWHTRHHARVLALSAITVGIARAHSAVNAQRSTRAIFDSDSFDILVDGGATSCISNSLADFVKPPKASSVRVKGFNGTTSSTRVGTVVWHILDDSGHRRTLRIQNTYYVPACPLRILSPQHYSQQTKDLRGTYATNFGDQVLFVWNRGRFKCTMPLSPATNVGILRSAPGHAVFSSFVGASNSPSPTHFCCPVISDDEANDSDADDDEDTLSPADSLEGEGEANINTDNPRPSDEQAPDEQPNATDEQPNERPDVIPFDLDHDDPLTNLTSQDDTWSKLDASTELLRWHYRLAHIPFANLRLMAARGEIPKRLAGCRVPKCQSCLYCTATKRAWRTKGKAGKLRTVTKPGQCVSVDQLESPVAGFVGQNKGYFFRKRYKVATVFVDHYSRLSFIYLQESTKGDETLLAKKAFEAHAASFGVKVFNYHADNGRFAERLFLEHAAQQGQTVTLCGVNAHFQNGIAEKRIRDLTERARTSLLHAMNRWPSAVSIHLWPYALRFANEVHNSAPSLRNGRSPLELFSGTPVRPQVLNFHPPFCPAYVLHNGLQGGGKRPNKWVRRSRTAVYLGTSPRHARSVALVLSLSTGYVSPQFHLKFDDFFETVQDKRSIPESKWQLLAHFVTATGKAVTPEGAISAKSKAKASRAPQTAVRDFSNVDFANQDGPDDFIDDPERSAPPAAPPEGEPIPDEPPDPERHRHPDSTRRSTRVSAPPRRFMEEVYSVLDETEAIEDYETQHLAEDPIAFAASKSDPDTLHYGEAMKASDAKEFKKAMLVEVNAHTDKGHWELWAKADVPSGQDVLPAVWAFKRKRRIDSREVYKYKARINAHGGKQTQGVNYWETYSPVVNWFSIRLCLILSLLFNWKTRQLDFVLAFPQADAECDLFIELPRGVSFSGVHRSTHCFKLIKNLYGTKQAGRVWNQHLVDGLVGKLKFTQSAVDECVFYRGTTILLIYVDDGILCGPSAVEISAILRELAAIFDITDEGEIDTYLGVKITRPTADTIELTQPHLIQQILDDLGMKPNTKTKDKAAPSSTILRRDLDGEPFDEDWDYRSVIGKLNFLEKSTRPEIAYAVHQCARFASNPKKSHANAVRYLCRYLAGTKDKGLILRADPTKSFEVHVDCDFAGNWVKEDAMNDPSTAKSRTGYIISYGGCPVLWASKLQTEVVLSTTESEYVGLSESLRIAIVMMNLLLEMKTFGIEIPSANPRVFCKLFEDNAGAIHLAKVPKMRPRTRHINQKYHHFREWVKTTADGKGTIEIYPIDTLEQPADLLTKPLDLASFQKHRHTIMGW